MLTWHRMYMFPFGRKFHCEGKREFDFLLKANYTMKKLLKRPFFNFAKFSFGAEQQWPILKNLIRKMFQACKKTRQSKFADTYIFTSFIWEHFLITEAFGELGT